MASPKDVVAAQLQTGQWLIEKLTEDLSDGEYFKPPIEGANHPGWLLGHIATSEDWALALITGGPKRIPAAMHELFGGSSTCVADSSKYPSRKEIDDLFVSSRADTVEALKMFDERKWNDPSPDEAPKDFFPTLGSLWGMQSTHQFWHIGHLSVCRLALKKKRVLD